MIDNSENPKQKIVKNNFKKEIYTENDKTEDDIICQTNSSLAEQSFFKTLNNLKKNDETEISKLSKNVISSMYNQINNQENINKINYDDLVFLQNSSSHSPKKKNNKKIIEDFIERNNYPKNIKNDLNENNKSKIDDSIEIDNDNLENNIKKSLTNNDNKKIFEEFLEREKRHEIILREYREKQKQEQDKNLLKDIKEKPEINKKSVEMAFKKNKSEKVFERLVGNDNKKSNILDKKKSNNIKGKKVNNNNSINCNNIDISKSQNLKSKKKYCFRPKSNNNVIKSLSSNNFYKKQNDNKNSPMEIEKINKNSKEILNNAKNNIKTKSNNKYNTLSGMAKSSKKRNDIKRKKNEKIHETELFNKFNSISTTVKMKIAQMDTINSLIDKLLYDKISIKKYDRIVIEKYGIDFLLFCELLFDLGFIYFCHKKINYEELNDEYIKEINFQPFLKKFKVNKEFIFNEILITNEAYSSILNNFKIISNSNNINNFYNAINNNKKIFTIEDFKLFIFILSDIFVGFEKDDKKDSSKETNNIIQKNNNNISTSSNKNNKSSNSNNNNINSDIYLIRKIYRIIPNKKLEEFSIKDINNYKDFFKYMIDIHNLYKKEKNSTKKDNHLTFSPKINKKINFKLKNINENMNFQERNKILTVKSEKHKREISKKAEKEINDICPFKPKFKLYKRVKNLEEVLDKEKIEKELKEKRKEEKKRKEELKEKENREKKEKEKKDKEELEIKESMKYPYSPKINIPLKMELYNNSLLQNDNLLKKKFEELRKLNFKKKLNNFQNNHREILSNDLFKEKRKNKQILNHLINNANDGRMCMSLEKKSNKDTFDIFEKKNNKDDDEEGYRSNVLELLNLKNKKKHPIFDMEIKLQNENFMIEISHKDNYKKKCFNFCKEHNLGIESYEKMIKSIENKLKEIDTYNI
jgi:hypothetical protein